VIGHVGDTKDTGYLKELMDNGSYVGMDRFGMDFILPFEDRVRTVAILQDGYSDRMVLVDASCLDWITDRICHRPTGTELHYNHLIEAGCTSAAGERCNAGTGGPNADPQPKDHFRTPERVLVALPECSIW
jgi:predicted metal-dependent phosphotriesterase family hydrolase